MVKCVFDNRFIAELPADPLRTAGPRQVQASAFSPVAATPVRAPRTVHFNAGLAGRLGLSPEAIGEERFAQVFSGNELLDGMQPWAANYGGHQFGHWAGQLGDGRALSLGELALPDGERWELQLKGAGPTPYSRGADGRAVMRSSLREYVCSEAMHHLGIPTTRALSLVATGEDVVRDMFYDGNPAPEPGAVVCRLAPGFIRFGSFELPAQRGERELLQALLAFTVDRDFPGHCIDDEDGRVAWFTQVCERTATLMAHWMRVGFVHGVMNTDNMSILGQTIDYGPYGWVDEFDPDFTPNTTDAQHRRYRYAAQPEIGWWNLSRLAGALSSLFDGRERLEAGLEAYVARFQAEQARMFGAKLGLAEVREGDHALAQRLFALMQRGGVDMTLMFRLLGQLDARRPHVGGLGEAFYDDARAAAVADDLQEWLDALARRWAGQGVDDASRRAGMDAVNPRYVFRNYLGQQAIDALAAGDRAPLDQLVEVLAAPYDEQPAHAALAARRPQWARDRAGCSMLSCSS